MDVSNSLMRLVSCVLNPLVGASGTFRTLEAGGVGAHAEPSGVGGGDAGADHAGVEAEEVGGQPAHPATATTNSMSPSARRQGLSVRISENGRTMGASRGNWQCVNDLGGARP